MFDEVTAFFGKDPEAHVFGDDNNIVVVLPTLDFQVLPEVNETFRIGPYIMTCLYVGGYIVVGQILPTL